MDEELSVLSDVAFRLEKAGIPYMLTGSLALSFYALPRMTRDIDLVIDPEQRSARDLAALFENGYHVFEEAIAGALKRRAMFNVIHKEALIKVDMVVRKLDPLRVLEFSQRQRVMFRDIPIFIVKKEDLVLAKLLWAKDSRSEVQLKDVRNLLATGCDASYISGWVEKLGLVDLWKEVSRG
jgi:hypothetical protein